MPASSSRRLVAAAAAALVLAVSGCGSDDDSGDPYKDDAAAATRQVSALGDRVASAVQQVGRASERRIATTFADLAGDVRRQIASVRALEPPAEDEPKVAGLAAALSRARRDLQAISDTARRRDPAGFRASVELFLRDSVKVRMANNTLKRAVGVPPGPPPADDD